MHDRKPVSTAAARTLLATALSAIGLSPALAQSPERIAFTPASALTSQFDTFVETIAADSPAMLGNSLSPGCQTGLADQSTPADQLTLDGLISLALQSNPAIDQAAAQVAAAEGRVYQVGLQPNPAAGFEFEQLGSDGRAEQYGVAFAQRIVRPQKLDLNRSVASHEVERLQQELAAQQQRVRTDVTIAFIGVLRAQRQLELTRDLVTISQRGVGVANELFAAGEVGRADVLQAELEVETTDVLLQNAQNRSVAAWQQLAAVTGQPTLQAQPLAGEITDNLPEINYDEALLRLRNTSPELAAAYAAVERARCTLQRAKVEPLPDLSVEGSINWRDNGIGGDADGGLTVLVPLPIWDKNKGAIRQAHFELVAAQRNISRLELEFQNRLAPVYERYRNAMQQVDRYQNRILPKSAETLQLTRQTYELGEIGFITLLTAQRTYARSQIAYLDSLQELRIAAAEIDGLLLRDSLDQR